MKTGPILYEDKNVPSWSWMFYDGGIDFLTHSMLRVPDFGKLRFDSNRGIDIEVRQFQACYMEERGEKHMIFAGTDEVGFLYFDMDSAARIEFRNCVVIGISEDDDNDDPDKKYYILIVRKILGEGEYERLGVGQVQARYVSCKSDAGKLL